MADVEKLSAAVLLREQPSSERQLIPVLNEQHRDAAQLPAAGLIQQAISEDDDAIAAAFERFGSGEFELQVAASDRLHLSTWFSSTPLLLLFALERVTARHARRRHHRGEANLTGLTQVSKWL